MPYCGGTQSRKIIFLDIRAFLDYNEKYLYSFQGVFVEVARVLKRSFDPV